MVFDISTWESMLITAFVILRCLWVELFFMLAHRCHDLKDYFEFCVLNREKCLLISAWIFFLYCKYIKTCSITTMLGTLLMIDTVSKIRHILSFIHYTICGLCVLVYPFPLWWLREYRNFVLLSSSNRKYYPLFRVRSWNNGVHCMSLCSFTIWYTCHLHTYLKPVYIWFAVITHWSLVKPFGAVDLCQL